MTDNIVDLATERKQRQMLAARAAEGGDAFISGLQLAGHTFANLGWLLAAPVRAHDRQLTHAIYQVVLQRLGQIVDDAIADIDYASWNINTTMKQGRDVAFAAFTARMMSLIKARLDEDGWRPTNEHGP